MKSITTKSLALQHLKNEICLQAIQIEKTPGAAKRPETRLNILGIAVDHLDRQIDEDLIFAKK
ncbi:hypothetical protein [Persicobacter psychrovividus]|uniref:Uncharacterized protein n=1 Tax=Persicobacter psychrovividus TaxID=387638 RepID=A0ABN6LD56_9BACT|nr:hypothetical protein PEPS_34130 [Persicobacter psychrovividus]